MECVVEYAKSDRAKCKGCSSPLKKRSVKVGKKIQSPFHDGMMTLFYHPKCFFESVFIVDVRLLGKLSSLRWKDQIALECLVEKSKRKFALPGEASSPSAQAPTSDDGVLAHKRPADSKGEPSLKRRRGPQSIPPEVSPRVDSALSVQRTTEHWWTVKDAIEELSSSALTKFLKSNGIVLQEPTRDDLLLQSTHAIVHGVPEPCTKCGGACFVYKFGRDWICSGLTEWAKCPETIPIEDANVHQATLPPGQEWETIRPVLLEPVPPATMEAPESEDLQQPMSVRERLAAIKDHSNKDKPLYGCAVAAVGKLCMTQKAMKELVERLGGRFCSTVTEKVTHCISTHAILSKQNATNQKLQRALDLSIPIYGEGLLTHIEETEELPDDANAFLLDGNPSKSDREHEQQEKKKKRQEDEQAEASTTATFTVKGKGAVDPKSGLEDKGHVYVSEEGVVFSATLSAADITTGQNSFYMLQVIQSDRSSSRFWLWRRWGRTGTYIGNSTVSEYHKASNALEKFEALFQEKTGNDWVKRANFKKKKGKFNFVETEFDPAAILEDGDQLEEVQQYLNGVREAKDSALPPETVRLIQMLFDVEAMNDAMLEMKIDTAKLPLGVLSKNQIKSAFQVLSQIQCHIESQQSDVDGDEPMLGSDPELLGLSNKFYAFIPHDFGTQVPPLISSLEQVATESEMLQSLVDMEIATQLMRSCDTSNPIDTSYRSLHANISPVVPSSEEFGMVREFLTSSHGPTHSAYKLSLVHLFEREGEAERYEPFRSLHNRQLLWHGSRTTNCAGILSQGLRIAPPEAPVTGYMFGKGIYFAESASKSANYCHASKQNPYGILLLCEAALGDPVEYKKATYVSKLPEGKHSVQGLGRHITDPKKHIVLDGDLTVPMGKCVRSKVRSTALEYSEFVVYDVAQVLVRYAMIVQFEFRRGKG